MATLSKVLVANRGEIACRVLRTCRRLGLDTVAVYSSADAGALHARQASEAYLIGHGPAPTESYLLQDELLAIAKQAGADAIHPGYGFLSENASFSAAVDAAGVAFVGPPPSAIEAMGSKSRSKAIMDEAGVPTTPGYYNDAEQDAEFLLEKAIEIGFPVLIKAIMGGGGKGMRMVEKEEDFIAALAACQREATAAFGDGRVLLEKYLVNPRHVEVQIMADSHGNVVHLYERDCSLQRRHQKIIEEAPAGDLPKDVRERLGAMGCRAAAAVGYRGAGTVEFLLDSREPDQFYFCEMNTRLQVEHPITEQITGVDLVEWQLRVAAGEELPMKQSEIPCLGHAFEARVYAENPARGFLPATGTVWHHQPPATPNAGANEAGVRVDTGIAEGQDVGVYYDPMISKLITHGANREEALQKLIGALKRYQIAGVPTNIDFLIQCAKHPVFGQAGAINTGFLVDYSDDIHIKETTLPKPLAQAIGACSVMMLLENRIGDETPAVIAPWSSHSGSWRIGGTLGRARRTLMLEDGSTLECISNRDGSFEIHPASGEEEVKGTPILVAGVLRSDGSMQVTVDGTKRIALTSVLKLDGDKIRVRMWPEAMSDYFWQVDVMNPLVPTASAAELGSGHGLVKSPMPGKINRLNFAVGDTVKEGDVVLVMEAMKMEHAIKAPCSGILMEARHKAGDVVDFDQVLFLVGSEEAAEATSTSG